RIAALNLLLRQAVGANVVGEITARAQKNFNRCADLRLAEDFGNNVVPRRSSARENDRTALKPVLLGELAAYLDGMVQVAANRIFIVQHTLIDFHSAQAQALRPTRQSFHHFIKLFPIANSGAPLARAKLQQNIQALLSVLKKAA